MKVSPAIAALVLLLVVLVFACDEKQWREPTDPTAWDPSAIGMLHNETMEELDRRYDLSAAAENPSPASPNLIITSLQAVASEHGLVITQEEIIEVSQVVLSTFLDIRSNTGVDLTRPETITQIEAETAIRYIADRFPELEEARELARAFSKPDSGDLLRLVSGHDAQTPTVLGARIAMASAEFWSDEFGMACHRDPRCADLVGHTVSDVAGGLIGSLFGPIGTLIGSHAGSALWTMAHTCMLPVWGCD